MRQSIIRNFYPESPVLGSLIEKTVQAKLPIQSLENIHLLVCSDRLSKGSDQSTQVHDAVYSEFDKGLSSPVVFSYRTLASQWLADLRKQFGVQDWAIQRYPSLRLQLPNNISVFEFHRDSDYFHPFGEINHFLALTRSTETAALHLEQTLGWSDYAPLELEKFQSAIINTSVFRHGDLINIEGFTRVSIDFRALPSEVLLKTAPSHSLTKNRSFDCTDYFVHSSRLLVE